MSVHCWHKLGRIQPMSPPNIGWTCCHCGDVVWQRVDWELEKARQSVHGPYLPQTHQDMIYEPLPEGPCTQRKS